MGYIIKMACIDKTNKLGLKFRELVYLDNVFGKEKFTKDIDKAYVFISFARVQKIMEKINHIGNFICDYMKVH